MKSLLLRVGIDSGNGGSLAPIYEDGSFEYIPIPEERDTIETRTFGSMTNGMGTPYSEIIPNVEPDDPVHFDPEFGSYTYGDPTRKGSQLEELVEDDLLIFYAGLKPADYDDDPRLFVIGYFTVDSVFNLDEMEVSEREGFFEELDNNAHIKRTKVTTSSKHPDQDRYPVIVRGKPERSQLLETARPLSGPYVPDSSPNYRMLDRIADILGYSNKKDLTRASGRWLSPPSDEKFINWLSGNSEVIVEEDSTLRSYVLRHDSGFAPNPYHGYCTLATCKPNVRTSARPGDWIIGTGSRSKGDPDERLLYAMQVEETLTFDEYFESAEFEPKKPDTSSDRKSTGDNIYYTGDPLGGSVVDQNNGRDIFGLNSPDGNQVYYIEHLPWVQLENSNHGPVRIPDDTPSDPTDTAVLVSRHFWYFGDREVTLPENQRLRSQLIIGSGPDGKQGEEYVRDQDVIEEFISWLMCEYRIGQHGSPRDSSSDEQHETHSSC